MDRVIATNSVALAGADIAPLTGTPQYFTAGNPATSTPATVVPGYWLNQLQDEIINAIVGAGITPDRTNWSQLLAATKALGGNWSGFSTINSNPYTIPASGIGKFYQTPGGATASYTVTIVNASLVPGGSNIGIYNSSSAAMTLISHNFNTAYGSGSGTITLPAGQSIVLTGDLTSWNGTGGAGSIGAPVRPQATSGVGQWQSILPTGSGSTAYISMPAGGTWAYWASNNNQTYTGIAAGGSNVAGPFSLLNVLGFCWRIA